VRYRARRTCEVERKPAPSDRRRPDIAVRAGQCERAGARLYKRAAARDLASEALRRRGIDRQRCTAERDRTAIAGKRGRDEIETAEVEHPAVHDKARRVAECAGNFST